VLGANYTKELLRYIDADKLPEEYGGSCSNFIADQRPWPADWTPPPVEVGRPLGRDLGHACDPLGDVGHGAIMLTSFPYVRHTSSLQERRKVMPTPLAWATEAVPHYAKGVGEAEARPQLDAASDTPQAASVGLSVASLLEASAAPLLITAV
jgi:hypothetical protein